MREKFIEVRIEKAFLGKMKIMEEELEKIDEALLKLEQKIIAKQQQDALEKEAMQKDLKKAEIDYLNLRSSAESAVKKLDAIIEDMEKKD